MNGQQRNASSGRSPILVRRADGGTGSGDIDASGDSSIPRDIGRGVNSNKMLGTCEARRSWLVNWFRELQDRLRLVRVLCGHWLRVCDSDSVTTRLGTTGIFFDPPYSMHVERMLAWISHLLGQGPEPARRRGSSNRDNELYANDKSQDVDRLVAEVHVYCRQRGADPRYRIVLAGYDTEHNALEALGWRVVEWESQGGYANRGKANKKAENKKRERLWLSPHCLTGERVATLFDDVDE